MTLANSLYGKNGELLLSINVILNKNYIASIIKLGYSGVYIEDSLSKNIKVNNIISDNLKNKTIAALKNVFITSEETKSVLNYNKLDETKLLIESIVDEITNNKHVIVNLVDLKIFDDYTYYHSVNVTVLSIIMGVALDLNKRDLYKLGLAALLHDIGKIFIDKLILSKPSMLTEAEFDEIKKHSFFGYDYLKKMYDIPIAVDVAVLDHHEKYNGLGYPKQKSGENICLY